MQSLGRPQPGCRKALHLPRSLHVVVESCGSAEVPFVRFIYGQALQRAVHCQMADHLSPHVCRLDVSSGVPHHDYIETMF